MIRRLGVDYAQGYHISQPIPLTDILEMSQRDHVHDFPGPASI